MQVEIDILVEVMNECDQISLIRLFLNHLLYPLESKILTYNFRGVFFFFFCGGLHEKSRIHESA